MIKNMKIFKNTAFIIYIISLITFINVCLMLKIDLTWLFKNKKHNLMLFIFPSLFSESKKVYYSIIVRHIIKALLKHEKKENLDLFLNILSKIKQKNLIREMLSFSYHLSDYGQQYIKDKFPNHYKTIIYSNNIDLKNSVAVIKDMTGIHYTTYLQNKLITCFDQKIITKFESEINLNQLGVEQLLHNGKSARKIIINPEDVIQAINRCSEKKYNKIFNNKKGTQWLFDFFNQYPNQYDDLLIEKCDYLIDYFKHHNLILLHKLYQPMMNKSDKVKTLIMERLIEKLSENELEKWLKINKENILNFINTHQVDIEKIEITDYDKLYWLIQHNPDLPQDKEKKLFKNYLTTILNQHNKVEYLLSNYIKPDDFKWLIEKSVALDSIEEIKKVIVSYLTTNFYFYKYKKCGNFFKNYHNWLPKEILTSHLPSPYEISFSKLHWLTYSLKLIIENENQIKTQDREALYLIALTDPHQKISYYENIFNHYPHLLKEENLFNKYNQYSPIEIAFNQGNNNFIEYVFDKIDINHLNEKNFDALMNILLKQKKFSSHIILNLLRKIKKEFNWYNYEISETSPLYSYYVERATQYENNYLSKTISPSENDKTIVNKKRKKI